MATLGTMLNIGAVAAYAQSAKEILEKPLIIGASVSAGYGATSPGKKLALRYTADENIKTIAFNGRTSQDILGYVKDSDMQGRTIVVGVDLFFWDSVYGSVDKSIQALHSLMVQVTALEIPIILGKIPNLLASFQPNRDSINRELDRACKEYKQCHILPFDEVWQNIVQTGHLEMNNQRYPLRDLLPDGLHIGPIASQYLADMMLEILSTKNSRS